MKRLQWIVFIGIAIFYNAEVIAQSSSLENFIKLGLKADSVMLLHVNQRDFTSALASCNEKEEYFRKGESWGSFIQAINDKAWLYHSLDSLENFKRAVLTNFEIADKYLDNDHSQWLRAKEQVNSYYYMIGDYKSALDIIKEVIPLKESLGLSLYEIAVSYLNLGNAYNRLKDTENAISALKRSVNIIKEDPKIQLQAGRIYNNIGRAYKGRGEIDSALFYLDKAEFLFGKIKLEGRFKSHKVETYVLLAETWLDKKEFEKAKYYLDLAEKMPLSNKETVTRYERLGIYYRETGELEKSKLAILKANQLSEEFNTRFSPPLRARRNIELAESLIQNSELENALEVILEGLNILAPSFDQKTIESNPIPEQLLDKPRALKLLQLKARILNEKYAQLDSIKYSKSSFDTYLVACDVIKHVRQGIRSTDSKNDLSKQTISVYEEAINLAYKLSKLTQNADYISTAFKMAESNKAQLLLENLNEQKARGYAGIPDSLYNKEKDLRLFLAELEDRAIRNGDNKNKDLIFNTKQELSQFTSFLEKTYPRYYSLKYHNDPIDPAFIQDKILTDNTALIEYFVGVNKIYVFVITKSNLVMNEIPKDALAMEQLVKFRQILKNRPGDDSAEKEYTDFVQSSRSIYKAFAQVAVDEIPENVNTLIVIPDDQINYIPFEVLLLEEPEEASYTLSSKKYLFEKFAINYNYSATLLNKVKSKKVSEFEGDFVGYAPTFNAEEDASDRSFPAFELSNLKCSKDEVQSIASIVGGDKKMSEHATKQNFLNEAKNYKIIHLATHAFVDQNDSKLNKIFLQDDFLSDVNLYNLELNTELAVLSACNTGSGELLKGEGVMNLARGFINAGCSSTLMSMWSVDDCTTSDLMVLFYKELRTGLNKDEALRQAKLKYLSTANKTKLHPYYWAAFVPFGDMKAMQLNKPWYANTILLSLIGLSMIVLVFFYFKKEKSS